MDRDHSLANQLSIDQPFIRKLRETILETKKFPYRPGKLDTEPILQHGWLIPNLLHIDLYTWQRWAYWIACMEPGQLIDAPIPQIAWVSTPNPTPAMKMLQACLDNIP